MTTPERPDDDVWLAEIEARNLTLEAIVGDLHWQARRYADGRSSYATGLFNGHTRALLAMGIELNPTGDGTVWARDAMGRAFDGLTDEEAAQGRPPDAVLDDPTVGTLRNQLRASEAERERLAAELADERERNAPLRARIKVIQDRCDQVAVEQRRKYRAALEQGIDLWRLEEIVGRLGSLEAAQERAE